MASPNCSNPTTFGILDTTTSTQANTTFVQADPSNFRTIVQKLTGAVPPPPDDRSHHKPPVTCHHHQNKHTQLKHPAFKLHERRQNTNNYNNLNLNIDNNNNHIITAGSFLCSPVSTLDFLSPSVHGCVIGSFEEAAEERAIAEKGFFLHPAILVPISYSTSTTPRGGRRAHEPPELLPLFPLRSPRDDADDIIDCNASN